jgi:hypothetical protein
MNLARPLAATKVHMNKAIGRNQCFVFSAYSADLSASALSTQRRMGELPVVNHERRPSTVNFNGEARRFAECAEVNDLRLPLIPKALRSMLIQTTDSRIVASREDSSH